MLPPFLSLPPNIHIHTNSVYVGVFLCVRELEKVSSTKARIIKCELIKLLGNKKKGLGVIFQKDVPSKANYQNYRHKLLKTFHYIYEDMKTPIVWVIQPRLEYAAVV